mgnify:CR=1 FL=1
MIKILGTLKILKKFEINGYNQINENINLNKKILAKK